MPDFHRRCLFQPMTTKKEELKEENRQQPWGVKRKQNEKGGGNCWLRSNAYEFKARRAAITPSFYVGYSSPHFPRLLR